MDKIKDLTNQLIDEGCFSIKKLQDRYLGKMDDNTSIYMIWDEYIQEKRNEGDLERQTWVKTYGIVLLKIMVEG